MEQRRAHAAGQRGPTLQVAEPGALDCGCIGTERREGVGNAAPGQVGSGIEAAAIAIRAADPQAGAARNDDLRIEGANVVDGQPGPFQCAGQPVGQEDIRSRQQAAEQLAARLGLDVDRDAALAAVTQLEDEVGVRAGRCAGEPADHQGSPRVAEGDTLHFDDVRAPVRKGRAGRRHIGPRCQFDNPHPLKDATARA
ncbi:hypothetical protein ATCCBAA256_35970 [Mycobacterium montefiorense]|nr:hypothetical protein ATCCBAA256_35970 [Mycobacterium montefiorense]